MTTTCASRSARRWYAAARRTGELGPSGLRRRFRTRSSWTTSRAPPARSRTPSAGWPAGPSRSRGAAACAPPGCSARRWPSAPRPPTSTVNRKALPTRRALTAAYGGKASGVRQALGQPEVSEDAGVGEPGDRRDRVALEREHDQPVGAGDRRRRVREVAAERRLPVGSGGHDTQRRAPPLGSVTQEDGDRLVSLVLERLGRHREQGVVGEQGDDLVDVAAVDGVREPPDQSALAGGVRPRRVVPVGGRQPRLERRAGALQGALDRGLARVEHLSAT